MHLVLWFLLRSELLTYGEPLNLWMTFASSLLLRKFCLWLLPSWHVLRDCLWIYFAWSCKLLGIYINIFSYTFRSLGLLSLQVLHLCLFPLFCDDVLGGVSPDFSGSHCGFFALVFGFGSVLIEYIKGFQRPLVFPVMSVIGTLYFHTSGWKVGLGFAFNF